MILEGYGLTETSPVLTASRPDKIRFGSPGIPLSNVEIKIATDGEILAKGPNIMKGYYKSSKLTPSLTVILYKCFYVWRGNLQTSQSWSHSSLSVLLFC